MWMLFKVRWHSGSLCDCPQSSLLVQTPVMDLFTAQLPLLCLIYLVGDFSCLFSHSFSLHRVHSLCASLVSVFLIDHHSFTILMLPTISSFCWSCWGRPPLVPWIVLVQFPGIYWGCWFAYWGSPSLPLLVLLLLIFLCCFHVIVFLLHIDQPLPSCSFSFCSSLFLVWEVLLLPVVL